MADTENSSSAGERTEKPSARRLKDARERGQIARSPDLGPAISLVAVTLSLGWFGAQMVTLVAARMASGLATLGDHARTGADGAAIATQLVGDAGLLVRVAGPPAVVAGLVAAFVGLAQGGFAPTPKAFNVSWSRLSLSNGLAKFRPLQSIPQLLKSVIGMTTVGTVAYLLIRPWFDEAPGLVGMTPIESFRLGWSHLWTLLWRTSLTLMVLASTDYAWQRWRWFSDLKMTRQEVRDEARQNEGNPEVKGRVRKVQRAMARHRMLKAVETSTVVITNPTHFAVALEYRRSEMTAPVVVAKGADHMAARIRAVAREHGVPIVENVTLARALYKAADLGDTIPADLFGAVAEVLAYLVRLKQLML